MENHTHLELRITGILCHFMMETHPFDLDFHLNQYFTPGGEFFDINSNFTDYAPGTGFSYSNIGAALVGLLAEEISNQSFKRIL